VFISLKSYKKLLKLNYIITNYQTPTNIRGVNYLKVLVNSNKIRNSFLKKSLISSFFNLQVSKFLNIPIFFRLECIKFSTQFISINVNLILKKFKRYASFFGGINNQLEFILASFFTLITKDVTFFVNWVKGRFEPTFYRKHKKLLYLIKLFFINYMSIYFNFFNCLGFYFKIRGKIGVGGN
jgi:hypothetical protein